VKLQLLQELLALNQAFEETVRRLERMEHVRLFDKEQLRYTRAEVENARVDANREFFDKFGKIVEQDARWAYKFRRNYDQRTKDPFDFYLEVKEREEARRKKRLPPRVVLLPGWDKDDEEHRDEEHTRKRKPAVNEGKCSGRAGSVPLNRTSQGDKGVSRARGRKAAR
jgi:hypothetical protein